MKKLLALLAVGLVAVMPVSANAFSQGGNISVGDTVDILDGPFVFDSLFGPAAEGGAIWTFTFENNTASDIISAVNITTVNQLTGAFAGGVDFNFGGDMQSVGEGDSATLNFFALIPAMDSITFTVDYGDFAPKQGANGFADIDFQVQAVPLPASILMLLGAVGGLGMLGRRRKEMA